MSHLQHGIVNSNLGWLCVRRARAYATFAAGGIARCTDRVHLPAPNFRLLARAPWRALRLKLLRRTDCSRHRPPPGCDTPADCLRPALWWRVSHTRLLWRRCARSHLAKSRKPTPDYLPHCHYPDRRPALVAIVRWPPAYARYRPGRRQDYYARSNYPAEFQGSSANARSPHRFCVAAIEQALAHNGLRHFHRTVRGRGDSL